jgi:hypothetical protein
LGTPQSYNGIAQITRVQYGPLKDLGEVGSVSRDEILEVIRTFVMSPMGSRFRTSFTVSRVYLAEALVRGGLAPQYLPPQSHYSDVRDEMTKLFVESAQAGPNGPIFFDATSGGQFRPDDRLSRLTAAVGLVRAAGLRSEAESKAGIALPYLDVGTVPAAYRGYVATAVAHGLLNTDATLFRPQTALTRGELAHAMVVLGRIRN